MRGLLTRAWWQRPVDPKWIRRLGWLMIWLMIPYLTAWVVVWVLNPALWGPCVLAWVVGVWSVSCGWRWTGYQR